MEPNNHQHQELVSQYRTLLETSTDGFFINVGGVVRYANPAFQRLLGASSEAELLGRRVLDFIDPRCTNSCSARAMPPSRARDRSSRSRSNTYGWMARAWMSRSLRSASSEKASAAAWSPYGTSPNASRPSGTKRLEEQLRQSHKMEALGTLAGGVAHDFNNILSSVIGNADLAAEELPRGHPARYHLDEILAAASRAKGLTGQVLASAGGSDSACSPWTFARPCWESCRCFERRFPRGSAFEKSCQKGASRSSGT